MPHAYTEDQLVEQPAIGLFAELGRAIAGPPPNAGTAGEPRGAGLIGREEKGDVVLASRLSRPWAGLDLLYPALAAEAVSHGGLIEPLTAERRKSLISSVFLFVKKTS